jgi:hypothetical protein
LRRVALHLDASPDFVGPVRPTFSGGCLCWSWTTPWGSWCFGWGERPGQDLPASLEFFLRSWLRGVRWRRRFWWRWIVRRTTKRCRRRSMFFVVGFLVGFVDPLAGVGGGVFLAVGLLGVDVNLARAVGPSWRRLLWLGLSRRGLRILGLCGGGCVAGRVFGDASWPAGVEGAVEVGAWGFSGGFCFVG